MGLFHRFRSIPSPRGLDVADDGLATDLDGNVFDSDRLLALGAMPVEGVEQHREGARELTSLVQVFMPQAGRVAVQGDRVAVHRGIVAGEHLSRDHPFKSLGPRRA